MRVPFFVILALLFAPRAIAVAEEARCETGPICASTMQTDASSRIGRNRIEMRRGTALVDCNRSGSETASAAYHNMPSMAEIEPEKIAPIAPTARPPSSDDKPETPFDTLEISTRTFFTFLRYPNPALRDVVAVRDDTRLVWIKRSGINQTISGEGLREFLLSMFKPNEKVVFKFADPVIFADGPFGRVSRKFSVEEEGRRPECATFYGEAVHQRETGWQFVQLSIVMGERFAPCTLSEP